MDSLYLVEPPLPGPTRQSSPVVSSPVVEATLVKA